MALVNKRQVDPTNPQQAAVRGITQPAQPRAAMQTMTAGMRPAGWEDDDVAAQVAEITSKGTPVMRQARSAGMRQANSRGMLNSTMAIQAAEDSAYRVAVPIASQNAAQRATRNQIRLDAGYQSERQETDIAAQLERMRTQAGFDREGRAENFGYQTQLNAQQIGAEMERLTTQLTHATASQATEIRARMSELQANIAGQSQLSAQNFGQQGQLNQAGYAAESALSRQNFGQQGQLNQAGYAAERQNLQLQLANANAQQATEIRARMDMLDQEWANRGELSTQEFGQNTSLQGQQIGAERERMYLGNDFNVAMAGIQQGNAVDLTQIQAGLQSTLQSQGNTEQMQRMTQEFGQSMQINRQQNEAALGQIAASGDQRMRELAGQAAASLNELTLSLNQRNSEATAAAAIQLFQAETQLRAALLSNPEMPAAERSMYERAISTLTGPTRNYVNGVFGVSSTGGPAVTSVRQTVGDNNPNSYTATTPPSARPPAGTEWVRSGGGWTTQPIRPTGMAPGGGGGV